MIGELSSSSTRWVTIFFLYDGWLTVLTFWSLAAPSPPPKPRQQVRWDQLTDVEFMVNGSRCTIYTAFYGTSPVVVKVMRKDVQDKDLVRQVCVFLRKHEKIRQL